MITLDAVEATHTLTLVLRHGDIHGMCVNTPDPWPQDAACLPDFCAPVQPYHIGGHVPHVMQLPRACRRPF